HRPGWVDTSSDSQCAGFGVTGGRTTYLNADTCLESRYTQRIEYLWVHRCICGGPFRAGCGDPGWYQPVSTAASPWPGSCSISLRQFSRCFNDRDTTDHSYWR